MSQKTKTVKKISELQELVVEKLCKTDGVREAIVRRVSGYDHFWWFGSNTDIVENSSFFFFFFFFNLWECFQYNIAVYLKFKTLAKLISFCFQIAPNYILHKKLGGGGGRGMPPNLVALKYLTYPLASLVYAMCICRHFGIKQKFCQQLLYSIKHTLQVTDNCLQTSFVRSVKYVSF